jgi:AcrR family transcriptional regulator
MSTDERTLRADARRNRERIMAAGRELFAREGPQAQMDEIAAHAGVGIGTVYRHFPTKDALLTAMTSPILCKRSRRSCSAPPRRSRATWAFSSR